MTAEGKLTRKILEILEGASKGRNRLGVAGLEQIYKAFTGIDSERSYTVLIREINEAFGFTVIEAVEDKDDAFKGFFLTPHFVLFLIKQVIEEMKK